LSNASVTTNLGSSILISIYSSGMISWRIWRIWRISRSFSRLSEGPQLTFFLAILVESAALQTATTICVLATFQFESSGQVIVSRIASAILGISTVLIHARIGLGWGHDANRQSKSRFNPTRVNFTQSSHSTPAHELDDGPAKGQSLTTDIIQYNTMLLREGPIGYPYYM